LCKWHKRLRSGYDRIAGALANLGHNVSDQTIGNVLKRHGIAPARKRSQSTTWRDFISAHMAVLAGTDFFTIEVLTWRSDDIRPVLPSPGNPAGHPRWLRPPVVPRIFAQPQLAVA
jgi:hypothetical protein